MPANPRGRRQRSARRTARPQAHPRPAETGAAEAGAVENGAAEAGAAKARPAEARPAEVQAVAQPAEARPAEVQAVAQPEEARRRGARRAGRGAATPGQARRASRPDRLVAHDAPYVLAELRRIALVTFGTVGLLIVLVVVDRLQ